MKHKTLVSFQGVVNYNVIEDILDKYNSNQDIQSLSPVVIKRTFSILVESLENCIKHQATSSEMEKASEIKLVLSKSDTKLHISIGNFIDSNKTAALIDNVNHLNGLNKMQLNAYYRSAIVKASISDKGGAGLGLIEIARYTTQNIELSLSKKNTFITLNFFIDLKIEL